MTMHDAPRNYPEIPKGAEDCAAAGMQLVREHDSFKATKKTPTIWPNTNLRGLLPVNDMVVPHSELAMHTGAAGARIITCFLTPDGAYAIYTDKDGKCGFIHGRQNEVLQNGLIDKINSLWPITAPSAYSPSAYGPSSEIAQEAAVSERLSQ